MKYNDNEIFLYCNYIEIKYNYNSQWREYNDKCIKISLEEENIINIDRLNLNGDNMKDINLKSFFNSIKLIIQKFEKENIVPLQCVAICKNLMNSKFRRPFNLTEAIMEHY
jgi:hypothetical protein